MSEVIKHPFRVRRIDGWHGEKYAVFNEITKKTWRSFVSRKDAFECAYFFNGNIGQYHIGLWY